MAHMRGFLSLARVTSGSVPAFFLVPMSVLALSTFCLAGDGEHPLYRQPEGPQWLWGDDVLIWDMSDSSPYMGQGYTYCDMVVTDDDVIYATAFCDGGVESDTIGIFYSLDFGASWQEVTKGTTGGWTVMDPEVLVTDDYILVFHVKHPPSPGRGRASVARVDRSTHSWEATYNIGWLSAPGADTCVSISAAYDPASGDVWAFVDDYVASDPKQLFMTVSSDQGATWSPMELVAENVLRHSADVGPGSICYLVYQHETTGTLSSMAFLPGDVHEAEIGPAAYLAAPVVATEWAGDQLVGVAYHDGSGAVRVSTSSDSCKTWQAGFQVGAGVYPFLDVRVGSCLASCAFRSSSTGKVSVVTASDIEALQGSSPASVSDYVTWLGAIPVTRQLGLLGQANLLYLGNGRSDLYYDYTGNPGGIEGESGGAPGPAVITVSPNPSCSGSSLSFDFRLSQPMEVALRVYDLRGCLVETVFSGTASHEEVVWSRDIPAGLYLAVLESAQGTRLGGVRLVRI